MAQITKTCRVCGKEYLTCRTKPMPGVFVWQAVACSPECGAIYLRNLNAARGIREPEPPAPEVKPKAQRSTKRKQSASKKSDE